MNLRGSELSVNPRMERLIGLSRGADEFSIDLDIDVATSDDEEGRTNFSLLNDMGTCQKRVVKLAVLEGRGLLALAGWC